MSLQTSLFGRPRTAGEFFNTYADAEVRKAELRLAGFRNCRTARYHDHTLRDGTKVYRYVVRCEAK